MMPDVETQFPVVEEEFILPSLYIAYFFVFINLRKLNFFK